MTDPSCELCGKPAVFHETSIAQGAATTRHLCQEHGQSGWRDGLAHCDARLPATLSLLDDLRRMAERWGSQGP